MSTNICFIKFTEKKNGFVWVINENEIVGFIYDSKNDVCFIKLKDESCFEVEPKVLDFQFKGIRKKKSKS